MVATAKYGAPIFSSRLATCTCLLYTSAQEIDAQRTRRDLAEKKKSKLLEYNVTGQITDADFLKMNRQCDEEIEQYSRSLAELEEQQNSRADLNAHIAEIRRVLQAARDDAVNGLINRDFVQKYIDRIFVTVDNDKIQLQIKRCV